MVVEIILGVIVLLAAIATIKKDTSRRFKSFLLILAILAFVGSVAKSYNDDSEKKFLQEALTSTLYPSNSSYEKLCNEVDEVGKAAVFDKDAECHHSSDGMIVLLSDTKGEQRATVVFNRQNIADMFADHIKTSGNLNVINEAMQKLADYIKKSNRQSNNQKVINEAMQKLYDPKNLNEEFLDKVGILGFNIYFNMNDEHPFSYNYDPKFGVKIAFDKGKQKQIVQVSPEELKTFEQGKALDLFQRLGESFREKFKKASE